MFFTKIQKLSINVSEGNIWLSCIFLGDVISCTLLHLNLSSNMLKSILTAIYTSSANRVYCTLAKSCEIYKLADVVLDMNDLTLY